MTNYSTHLECDTCGSDTFVVELADDGGRHVECDICGATMFVIPAAEAAP